MDTGGVVPEVREGFRNFRIDRIRDMGVKTDRFRDEPGKTLADLFRAIESDRGANSGA